MSGDQRERMPEPTRLGQIRLAGSSLRQTEIHEQTSDCDIPLRGAFPHDALMRPRLDLLALTVLALQALTACLAPSPGEAVEPDLGAFTLVLVSEGEGTGGSDRFGARGVFERHRAFLEQEAEAGRLLVSGPFVQARSAQRGLLVFDLEDPDDVAQVLAGDPAVSAGLLRPEFYPLVTLGSLRDLPGMEQQRVRASGGEGGDSRRFLVVMVEDGQSAIEALQHPSIAPTILVLGQLGEPSPGGLFAILDLESAGELSARRRIAGPVAQTGRGAWRVWEWFSTPALEGFAFGGVAPQPPSSSASK
jgi:hypothetical protein